MTVACTPMATWNQSESADSSSSSEGIVASCLLSFSLRVSFRDVEAVGSALVFVCDGTRSVTMSDVQVLSAQRRYQRCERQCVTHLGGERCQRLFCAALNLRVHHCILFRHKPSHRTSNLVNTSTVDHGALTHDGRVRACGEGWRERGSGEGGHPLLGESKIVVIVAVAHSIFSGLVDAAMMVPPGKESVERFVTAHRGHVACSHSPRGHQWCWCYHYHSNHPPRPRCHSGLSQGTLQ